MEVGTFQGIVLAEPLLARQALVIVDDWRFVRDSESYAKPTTEDAISQSRRSCAQLFELPARYNGDHALWWNGVAVFSTMDRGQGRVDGLRFRRGPPCSRCLLFYACLSTLRETAPPPEILLFPLARTRIP